MPGAVPASCGGCTTTWSGTAIAHCGRCHRTFGGTKAFDMHRKYYKCVDPSGLKLELVGEIWRQPAPVAVAA